MRRQLGKSLKWNRPAKIQQHCAARQTRDGDRQMTLPRIPAVMMMGIAIVVWQFATDSLARADQPADVPTADRTRTEFVTMVLKPFWRATIIHEPIFFVEGLDNERPRGNLLFNPTEVISVTSGTRDFHFEPAVDFIVDKSAGQITLPLGSRIPVTTRDHLYPLMSSNLPKIARKSGDKTHGIFFDEGSAYHKLQVEVTYRHEAGQWRGPTPKYSGDSLPQTLAKLRKHEPVKIVLLRRQHLAW
jgi:acyl-CoA thioesterase I